MSDLKQLVELFEMIELNQSVLTEAVDKQALVRARAYLIAFQRTMSIFQPEEAQS